MSSEFAWQVSRHNWVDCAIICSDFLIYWQIQTLSTVLLTGHLVFSLSSSDSPFRPIVLFQSAYFLCCQSSISQYVSVSSPLGDKRTKTALFSLGQWDSLLWRVNEMRSSAWWRPIDSSERAILPRILRHIDHLQSLLGAVLSMCRSLHFGHSMAGEIQ